MPFEVFVALISVESNWSNYCRSYNKKSDTWDCGLGQINDRNFELFSKAYLDGKPLIWYHAKDNLTVSVRHFSEVLHYLKGNVRETLVAYNVGLNGRLNPRVHKIGLKYANRIYTRLQEIMS